MVRTLLTAGAAVLLALGLAGSASAQIRSGGSSGSSGIGSTGIGSTGIGGSSGGGFTGSGGLSGSSGGFTGSSSSGGCGFAGGSSSGAFTGSSGGSSSGGFTGSAGGFGGGTGGTSSSGYNGTGAYPINTANPISRYFGNPLAAGLPTATSSASSQYLRTFPEPLSFGSPIYGTTTTGTTSGLTGGVGGMGSATISPSSGFPGANTLGIRRTPSYMVTLAPDLERPPPAASAVRTDLQGVLARSDRLVSRNNIRVVMDGSTVVLRGQVRDDRERRLAEAIVRLTPGVREVRNELEPQRKGR